MKNSFKKKNSIIVKLPMFVVTIIIIQSVFILVALILGGVIKNARLNAFEIFQNKTESRKEYLELEMKHRWTNIDPFLRQISDNLSQSYDSNYLLIHSLTENVIDMLRASQATGAFFVLIDETEENGIKNPIHPAIHIRDYDPLANDYDNKDLYMITGPSEIAKEYKLPLDQTWAYNLDLENIQDHFIKKPYENANLSYDSKLLGYWSQPFKLSDNDLEIITYSMPVFDAEGDLRGIVGIEITINYLVQLLPASDIKQKDSLGYMLVYKKNQSSLYAPMVINGALQKRYIKEEPLIVQGVNKEKQIFRLLNHEGEQKIYLSLEQINLYRPNTPFEEESWYLAGLIHEKDLFSYVNSIQKIIVFAFIMSLIIGITGGLIFSYRFAKPIVNLSKNVRQNRKSEKITMVKTGLAEVDELAMVMEEVSRERIDSASRLSRIISLLDMPIGAFEIRKNSDQVLLTEQFLRIIGQSFADKKAFQEYLDQLMENPLEDEEDIYNIPGDMNKWVKIKKIEMEYVCIGIIQDVTEEMLQKREIRQQRDVDGLTDLLNHRAFMMYLHKIMKNEKIKTSALLMFDLDNLKNINDSYGHKWGDYYIKESVARLQKIGEREKILLGRRSGDEFVLLMHGYDNKKEIRNIIDDFYVHLQKTPLVFPDHGIRQIHVSGGLAWIEEWPVDYDDILNNADKALYKSKFGGKGKWYEYK